MRWAIWWTCIFDGLLRFFAAPDDDCSKKGVGNRVMDGKLDATGYCGSSCSRVFFLAMVSRHENKKRIFDLRDSKKKRKTRKVSAIP